MKKIFILIILFCSIVFSQNSWIRINQVGYLPNSIKVAVLVSKEKISFSDFLVKDALTDKVIFKSRAIKKFNKWGAFTESYRLDFSKLQKNGSYYIQVNDIKSPIVKINYNVYSGAADFILKYMRQQRCGYNPFLKDSCHTHDGFIIYHPNPAKDSTYIDVRGGWHDATDYLQYVTTSANAVFQMLFAYQKNPKIYSDNYDENGNPNKNNIPDILDEAKWGLDWLVRMNPEKAEMYNQIADDRDHRGFRLPNKDTVKYSPEKGLQRPVYFCTGKPQGVFQNKNRADGIASTAGKYASAYALGSTLLKKYYPEFSKMLEQKSIEAYNYGLENPGVCQTAPCTAPYFYEEDNFTDDMELAATQIFELTKDKKYLNDAINFGLKEPITPWMGADTARHYQWYPFINLGHYYLANNKNPKSKLFLTNIEDGLEKIYKKGKQNPFFIGIPFIWCSNNLVAAAITQADLYSNLTKDKKYLEMEAALRDWLFGCNPWGTSMIVGYPNYGDTPTDPHSSLTRVANYKIDGGLVDGPVYNSIYKNLKWLSLGSEDEYAEFQSDFIVYHDDYGDYSTNEPTMDGTASLSYYLSKLEKESGYREDDYIYNYGGIIRTNRNEKIIHLIFTGGDYADGGNVIREVLKKYNIKASFFFTGDFYRNKNYSEIIKNLKNDGHYLGAHSDKHLLYASWENRDSSLISKETFINDLKDNYLEMEKFGINTGEVRLFIPPYEWYNSEISSWANELGIQIINFTPGTSSNADYTIPGMGKSYVPSDTIFNRILNYEKKDPYGLNGFLLLLHIGTNESRTDKFYNRLDELISVFKKAGYSFRKINETIK